VEFAAGEQMVTVRSVELRGHEGAAQAFGRKNKDAKTIRDVQRRILTTPRNSEF
jgi:hypothetical protein